jgi:hypothetical protein
MGCRDRFCPTRSSSEVSESALLDFMNTYGPLTSPPSRRGRGLLAPADPPAKSARNCRGRVVVVYASWP